MKCPLKFGAYEFEGGEGCDADCAWLMHDLDDGYETCAVAVIAHSTGRQKYESDANSWVAANERRL